LAVGFEWEDGDCPFCTGDDWEIRDIKIDALQSSGRPVTGLKWQFVPFNAHMRARVEIGLSQ
jgi:hypothetical protein